MGRSSSCNEEAHAFRVAGHTRWRAAMPGQSNTVPLAATALTALTVPSCMPQVAACEPVAGDPGGTFTLAAGEAGGGRDKLSATTFSTPGTWRMSLVNSAT
jgi:hypothetical protein